MSEKQKTITNPMLVGAMELLKAENTPEHRKLVFQEVLHARFLSPVVIQPNPEPDENGVVKMPEDSKLNLLLLTAPDDKHYFMACTDMEEVKKWHGQSDYHVVGFKFSDFVKLLLDPDGNTHGVVVNPFSHNIMFTKEMIQDMLRKGQYPDL